MNKSSVPIKVRKLRNGDTRLESPSRYIIEELAKLLPHAGAGVSRGVFDTETLDTDGRVYYVLFTEDEMAVVEDDRTFVSDCAVIKMSLIEWAEDDIGQYEKRGFPRHLEGWYVPVSMLSKSDEEIGDYLMDELGKAYGKSPVLILWDLDKDKE